MIGYDLPLSIEVNGKDHPITNKGDYRVIQDCFAVLNDKDIPERFRIIDCLKIFFEDINSDEDVLFVFQDHVDEAVKKMFSFFNCNQIEIGRKTNLKLFDWEQDAQLVCAAVNNVAGTEIRSLPYLHWVTFMGYYISVGESVLATVIGLREKKARGKKLEKHEREYIMNNPQFFTTREQLKQQEEDDAWFESVWNKE